MALSLAEKAKRDIARLEKTVEKIGPRHEKARAAIEKKRAAHAKRAEALNKAEEKFGLLDSKRVEAEKYILALRNAIGNGVAVDTADVEAFVASAEADEVEAENDEVDDVEQDDEDDVL
jgi:hypothetical protein